MLNYVHDIPTKIYFGKNQISQLESILKPLGKKVLLAYGGGSIKKTGLYDTVKKILDAGNFEVVELSGIAPNPRIESVVEGVALCKHHQIDVILAVGGGSVIDCSKAIAAGVYYPGEDLWEMVKTSDHLQKALPLVDILTLSATGSEFDGGGVISNLKTKEKLGGLFTYPTASICDPTYTFSVSSYQSASGAADIMSHIMEGYFSKTKDSVLSDELAQGVLKTVIKNLPIVLKEPDNYSARANLMACASVACSGIPEYGKASTGWPCHAMEHELSAYYDITHGVGLAILTPSWMRYILQKDPSVTWRFVRFAKEVWNLEDQDETKIAYAGIDALEHFFKEAGIPMRLSELGIDDTYFEEMARHANRNGRLSNAFVALNEQDIVEIFKNCL